MSRDIRIHLDSDQLRSLQEWKVYYETQVNCDIEIKSDKQSQASAWREINYLLAKYFDVKILTCGNCWKLISVHSDHEWDITCTECKYTSEECNFPDFIY